ncbi:hypothetical protein [Hymenobacter jeongseonensis]|nr:hypothetical protein [Hymenobacter jeongseonensis]
MLLAASARSTAQVGGEAAVGSPLSIYPDSVLADVSHHPIGINLDFLTDDDQYLNPRRRLVDALKAMGVKYLRYPGGNKSDFYLFSHPPYRKAVPTLARTGPGAVGDRSIMLNEKGTAFKFPVLDFDEFMDICRAVGAEPVLVVAADEYTGPYPAGCTWASRQQLLDHAVEWVRYANKKMGYHVKYWMIANETWNHAPANGAAVYAEDVVAFSKAMKAVDPSIYIIPNGNTEAWWQTVLTKTAGHIDAICVSNYPFSACDTLRQLTRPVDIASRAIEQYASPADRLKLRVIVAEYGPFNWCAGAEDSFLNSMRNNLTNLEISLEQLQHPRVAFSCFWTTRWIENADGKHDGYNALDRDGNFNANGLGLMLLGNFLGSHMIRTRSRTPLKTYASIDKPHHKLYVYVLNPSSETVSIRPEIARSTLGAPSRAHELAGQNAGDTKPIWRLLPASGGTTQLIAGTSVRVLEYELP